MSENLSSFDKFKHLFIREYDAETARQCAVITAIGVSIDTRIADAITELSVRWITSVKLHTFFLADTLKVYVEDIFKDTIKRDFVLCLRDRLCVSLGNDIHQLISDISDYGGAPPENSHSDVRYSLVPAPIPQDLRSAIDGAKMDVTTILSNNSFLLVPLMIYLCADMIIGKKIGHGTTLPKQN